MSDNKDNPIKNKMTDDKYILMGLDDERAKDMAEVLGNKTCKKIIDFLAETKEASEQDIATALGIPLNTTEYNLNKLKKSGLVVSSKNFFWSRKGRKIEMYQLAKKHIIISPTKKPSMTAIRALLPIFLILIAAVLIVALVPKPVVNNPITVPGGSVSTLDASKLRQFSSYDDLKNFVKQNNEASGYFGYYGEGIVGMAKNAVAPTASAGAAQAESMDSSGAGGGRASDYSTTNIQVEGVDEADIVKNDGKYIYLVSGNKVKIVNAYPAENMKILSEITPNNSNSVSEIFINEDQLIVFASGYEELPYSESKCLAGIRCGSSYSDYVYTYIYDVSDRENPILEKEIKSEGSYVNSRMIGDYVYIVSNKYVDIAEPVPPVYYVRGVENKVAPESIYYWDYPDSNYVFTSITAVNVESGETNNKVYLTGYTGELYVSQDNIYLTYQKRMSYEEKFGRLIEEVYYKILPEAEKEKIGTVWGSKEASYLKMRNINEIVRNYSASLTGKEKDDFDNRFMEKLDEFEKIIEREDEKTVVHKININKGSVEYKGVGEAPGHILNQFSMDEYDGYFRIATTVGEVWEGNSVNNLYVLDKDLKLVGSVEGLAEGEKIYSVRFMGKRAYIVTFKKVDPLFVIDLTDQENPQVLGYLKITGFSDYLHPYDENHIIGIGKEAAPASDEEVNARDLNFAWYQGLKISVFDVSDVNNPIESAKIVVGDRGTDSDALYNHKAFLFDKEKGILVIPISLAEIDRNKYRTCTAEEMNSPDSYGYCLMPNTYGETVWTGAYVFNIDTDEITVRGKITHFDEYKPTYGAAKDDAVGTVRIIQGTNYTKTANDSWRQEQNYYYGDYYRGGYWTYADYDIDAMEGGIDYKNYFYDYGKRVQRSLYMDDVLYTISQAKIKANNLETVDEISEVDLGSEYNYYYPMYA